MPIDIPQRGFNGFPEPQIEAIQTIIQFLLGTSSLHNAGIRTPLLLSTDFTGAARRRGAPTIGAFEILT